MKILLLGDEESGYIWDHFDRDVFKNIDFIISCGDLKQSYLSFVVTMMNKPLYYVPGNHDVSYEEKPPEGCINIHNKIIIHKGIRIYGFGGSIWYNGNKYQYKEKEVHKVIKKNRFKFKKSKGIDILVSHSPALGLGDGDTNAHKGFSSFKEFIDLYEPKYHFHGHQHLNYAMQDRIIKYNNTTIVNAYNYYILEYK
ncbi:metallophosphoesterase family protein [Clostridium sp. DL1XJH146]